MIFKSSAVAILVSAMLTPSAAASTLVDGTNTANALSDKTVAFVDQQVATYNIRLTVKGALDQTYFEHGTNRKVILEEIDGQQQALLSEIKAQDPDAIVSNKIRLVGNMLYVQMRTDVAAIIAENELVESMTQINDAPLLTAKSKTLAAKDGESAYPYLKVNDDGESVTVAVIGQGVDYTHKSLGGEGTFEAYNEAFANVSNAWDGFPNDVVIGGFDFASEQIGYDYNPIEYFNDFIDSVVPDIEFKTGKGSGIATTVLQNAPNAKILAYKITGPNKYNRITWENREKLFAALEMAMDPNQDGDSEDRADIVLLDSSFYGFSAFYKRDDQGISSPSADIRMLRAVAGTGSLVVTTAGKNGHIQMYHNLGARGSTPEALTVGYVEKENNEFVIQSDSPIGPTRGEQVLKPDIMAVNEEVTVPLVSSGTGTKGLDADSYFTAAQVAGAAAHLMSTHPELTAAEIKALIVNNGNTFIHGSWGVPQQGGGVLNTVMADQAVALVMDKQTLLPSIAFGHVEVTDESSFSRLLTVKNISDEVQTFTLDAVLTGEKERNGAVDVMLPKQITIEPNSSIAIPMTVVVNGDLLGQHPMQTTSDYGMDGWENFAVHGYVRLSHDDKTKSIRLPWMIMPHHANELYRIPGEYLYKTIYEDSFYQKQGLTPELPPHDADWEKHSEYGFRYLINQVMVENTSSVAQTFHAFPAFYHVNNKPESKAESRGHIIQSVGGALIADQQCDSGERLSLALTFFEQFDTPMANHFERGDILFAAKLYTKQAVEHAKFNSESLASLSRNETMFITELKVRWNDNLQPTTWYIDQNMDFDMYDPQARVKQSSIATQVSPGGRSVVSSICTDKLFHDGITADDLDNFVGFQFVTDRQALPAKGARVITHNLRHGGEIENFAGAGETPGGEMELPVLPIDCATDSNFGAGWVNDDNDNCIRVFLEGDDNTGNGLVRFDLNSYFAETDADYFDPLDTTKNIDLFCAPVVTTVAACQLTHPRFTKPIKFYPPTDNPGQVMCYLDDDGQDTVAQCLGANMEGGQFGDATEMAFDLELKSVLLPAGETNNIGAASSKHKGTAVKMAIVEDGVEQSELDWKHELSIAPGQRAHVSMFRDVSCQGSFASGPDANCSPGAIIVNTATGYSLVTAAEGSFQRLLANQSFHVYESAVQGREIGQVRSATGSLWGTADTEMKLIAGNDSGAFQITDAGIIKVRDPSVLDFETTESYTLTVQAIRGNTWMNAVDITINVLNENDNAPVQIADIASIEGKISQQFMPLDIADSFADADGTGFIFSATGLPAGIEISKAGIIVGVPEVAGEFVATLTVSDGDNQFVTDLTFNIAGLEDDTQSNSGGSFGLGLLALAFVARRRFS